MQKATSQITLRLSEMDDHFAICRLNSTSEIPFWAREGGFYSFTRTNDELSVVCRQEDVPPGITCERDWVCLKVEGPLSFEMTGIMASIAGPLAEAGISIFTIGTYETDYILIKKERYEEAVGVLSARGHEVKRLANDAESNV